MKLITVMKLVRLLTVFLQFIEHIDLKGLYGNMTDILSFLNNNNNLKNYEEKQGYENSPKLLKNLKLKMLLVPPEHRNGAMPIIQAIQNVCY